MISINRPAKDPNHTVVSTGPVERYVFISRIENPPSLKLTLLTLLYIVIHIWSDAYVVKDHLYGESLTTMDIYNDPVDEIYLSLKQKKMNPPSWALLINIHSFIRLYVRYVYNSLWEWNQKTKKKKWQKKFYLDRGNYDVENKTWIPYNGTVQQMKGM